MYAADRSVRTETCGPTAPLSAEPNPSAGQMSTFTSIGATPDLRIKPELSAVGGNVYSSIPTVEGKGDYASMSGTSMASPYVAGASVLVKSYMAENWTGSYDAASMTENLMMSTVSPVIDPETKLPYSPRLQGSGLIDLSAATSSDVVLYTDADQYGDTKPVLNLGDDVARNGSYDLTFHARNMGKDAARYDVSVIAMSPAVLEQDGKTYMSSHDEALDVTVSGDKTVTLAAGATGDVKVSVSLSQSQKAKLDAAYENGIYVEGFVVLTAKDGGADLSIPFLAYYGDWSAPGMLDYATMLNEDTVPYSQLATELGAYFTSSFAYRLGANLSVTMDGTENTTLSLSDTTAFLFTGEQQQLVAFDTDTDTALTWTSSNADVASVDGSGLVTAKAPGVTTVTATTANGASVSCVVGVSDQLTYTGLRLDFDEMTTTMYFDSTIDLPGVYLEPYGFALSGKHNTYGTDGLTWSVSDPTIADLDEYSKTTLVANKGVKTGDSGVLLYMGLMLLALTGSAWVLRKKRAR